MASDKLFLSLSSSNLAPEWLKGFSQALKEHGFKVNTDQGIQHSNNSSSQETIERNLRNSDLIVHVMSDQDIMDGNFMFLAGVAIAGDEPLIAIVPKEDWNKRSTPNKKIHRFPISKQYCTYIKRDDWPEQTAQKVFDVYNGRKNNLVQKKSVAT